MTTVELFKDIGLYMSMKKTIDFTSKTTQNTWFSSKVSKTVSNVAFNKLQNLLHIPMDYGEALEYTYVRFKSLDSSGRVYYYFIHSATLIDDTTVAFQLVLDPIQTFMCEWEIGECMVNRKHCDRWDKTSSLPIREKSNIEGIQATYVGLSSDVIEHTTTFDNQYSISTTRRVGAVVFTYTNNYGFITAFTPILFNDDYKYNTNHITISGTSYRMPDIEACYNNSLFTYLGVDPESVVSMIFLPYMPIQGSISKMVVSGDFADYTWEFSNLEVTDFIKNDSENYAAIKLEKKETRFFNINVTRPTKPSNNVAYSDTFEPALYKEPYIIRKFISLDGIFNEDVPDIIINQDSSTIYLKTQIAPSQQVITISWNDSFESPATLALNKGMALVTTVMPAAFDVVTNAWLTYSLTQRDADRAIINNNNIQSAVSNLLFMGYGGALVGSRGGGEGYAQGLGKATIPAVGLASVASIAASVVNAHFAWENQKEYERKIQNQAQQITISGNSAYDNAKDEFNNPIYVELKCDDENYNVAAKNFRYYGYEINEWQKPNIKSRKYFDYILTNGAVIDGALNQNIKEQIANIFDNGITIFHGDYTTTLDYPTYENIERSLL